MAYYSPNFYKPDHLGEGEYEPNPFGNSYSYDFPPTQPLMGYSSYEFSEFNQTPYSAAHDHPTLTQSAITYSTTTFSEPNFFQYDPRYASKTHYIISYSTTDFNEPELEFIEEHFIGGYDITQTYGKPLSPSDEICYPRSMPDPNSISLDGFSNGSIVLPNEKEKIDANEPKHRDIIETNGAKEAEQQPSHGGNGSHVEEPVDSNQGEERKGIFVDDGQFNSNPWSGYGRNEDCDCEYENQVPQSSPCGNGSDAIDLCESIFGYWPCLYKKNDQKFSHGGQEVTADEESNPWNHWKGTTDYIFGSSYPYDDRRDGSSSGNYPIYGYERHNQAPHEYRQVEHDEHSWEIFKI